MSLLQVCSSMLVHDSKFQAVQDPASHQWTPHIWTTMLARQTSGEIFAASPLDAVHLSAASALCAPPDELPNERFVKLWRSIESYPLSLIGEIKFFTKTLFVTRSSITCSETTLWMWRVLSVHSYVTKIRQTLDKNPQKCMILFRPGSFLTKPVSMRSEYKESSKDVQSSFVAHTYWQHCVKTNLELLSLSHVDPWAKSIKQGITGKSTQNVLPVTQTRKGISYATSSGQVTVMAKCSRPSQYDHVGVEAVEVSEKLLTNFDSDTAVFLKSLGLIHPFVLFFDPLNVFSLPCSFRTLSNTCAIFLKIFSLCHGTCIEIWVTTF